MWEREREREISQRAEERGARGGARACVLCSSAHLLLLGRLAEMDHSLRLTEIVR